MRGILVASVIALALSGAAQAATVHDLQSLGYTVKVVSQSQNCKLWVASGFGITEKLGCDGTSGFQANVDAMADPETACDVKWQYNHHDQRSAVSQIDQLGYVVTADECAGKYTVTNRFTKASVYKGAGAGLVGLAAKLRPAAPKATSLPVLVSTCLPLCQTLTPITLQGDTSGGRVSLSVTVTLADVVLALEKRDKASVEPLLSSAISSALGRKLVVTDTTACTIRDNPIDCSPLYGLISDTQVTVTFKGTTATAVGLPVPKVAKNPPRPTG
ncbi:MAG TPA: hypothetical protein VG652_05810 [Gaiellaceae bacterium]|nr:hypothetical protein [Gaiellaceae bacterium]